tara:strand:- start:264 stop:446 length:183 start_codon:yes stop_codon:yes gene_type:complete
MDKQTKIDLDITEPESKEWEEAWKHWQLNREENKRAGTQTITIGDTVTITVKAGETIRIE